MTQRHNIIRNGLELFSLLFCLLWSHCNSQLSTVGPSTTTPMPDNALTLDYTNPPQRGREFTLLNKVGAGQIFSPHLTSNNQGGSPVNDHLDDLLENQIQAFNDVHNYVTFKDRRACYITSDSSFSFSIGETGDTRFVALNIRDERKAKTQVMDIEVERIRYPCSVAKLYLQEEQPNTIQGGSHILLEPTPYCPLESPIRLQIKPEVRLWIAVYNTNLTQHSDVSPSNANIGVMFRVKINADIEVEMACGDLPEPGTGIQRGSGLSQDHVTVIVVLLLLAAIAVLVVVGIVLYCKRRSRQNAGDDPEKTAARSAPSDSYAQLRPTAPNSTETQISSKTTTSSAKSAAKPNVYERIDSIDIGDQYSEIPADIGDPPNTSGAVVDGVEAKDSGSNPAGITQSEQKTQSPQGGAHTQTENTSSSINDTGNNTTDTGHLYSKSVKTNTDKNSNFQKGGLHPHNDSEQVFEENDVYESAASIKPISEGDETAANQIAGDYERPLVVGVGGNAERHSGGDRLGQTDISKRDSVVIMKENNIYVSDSKIYPSIYDGLNH